MRLAIPLSVRVCTALLLLVAVASVLLPYLSHWQVATLDWDHVGVSPSWRAGHVFGTDRLGRDLFVRTLAGVRVSLAIGLLATLVSVVIGVSVGAVAGFLGGRTDALLMRLVDVLYSLPYIFFVILLTVSLGRSPLAVLLAIAAVGWLTMARVVRAQTQALRQREFVTAARAMGVSTPTILWRHIIPNVAGPVVVYATLTVPSLILLESFLSFLGLGVQEPAASLGNLMAQGAAEMEGAPWMLLVPGSFLVGIVLIIGILGDALRDWVDPRGR